MVSADCHIRNDYIGWVCTPHTGVASMETSKLYTKCFLEDKIWGPASFLFLTVGRLERSSSDSSAGCVPAPWKKFVLFNTSPQILEQAPHSYCNGPFRQFLQGPTWLGVGGTVSWSPVISSLLFPRPSFTSASLPTLNNTITYYIIPIYAIPTPNALSSKNALTVKSFCFVLPYLHVVIEVLCGPLYHQT